MTGAGDVRGVVARQKTAAGVPGVPVALLRGGDVRRVTLTDSEGTFSFEGVEGGSWRVRPVATGLAGLDARFDAVEPIEWEITVDASPVDLVFAVVGLLPPRITGRVTCGGTGVAGARVRVVGGAADVVASTDASGLYSVLDLYPGSYAVWASDAPCALNPTHRVVELRQGQLAEAHFEGSP